LNNLPQNKVVSAEEAIAGIQPGSHVFVGTACATPRVLVKSLEESKKNLADVRLYHFLTNGAMPLKDGLPATKFQHYSFFAGTDVRDAIKKGKADYIPISVAQVPRLLENGRISIDTAFIQVSLPNEQGFVSLGVSVDVIPAVIANAKTVIAEVNPHMPQTQGNSFVSLDDIDYFVPVETPVIEFLHQPVDAVAEQIARYIASLIEDGSTLQIGLGRVPNEMLKYLSGRKNLGIHSDLITDPLIHLIEEGVVTGRSKPIHEGQVVASYCLGTKKLYDLIDKNSLFSFHPIEYVCDFARIAAHKRFVSVTQAFAVDLTGQVCADQFEGEFYSGVSTQQEFLLGAAASEGGKPIICLTSMTDDGKKSRIRPLLLEGEGVTIARSDVHYVVTEYGSAYLFGKSIRERALALIEIAHPSFRPWLLEHAKKLGYVRADQALKSRGGYPVEEERNVCLKNDRMVLIRPSRASDVRMLQELFYSMSKEDVYTRFFRRLESLGVSEAQFLCNVDYDNDVAFLAVTGEREQEKIVGSSCYFVNPSTNLAEVAYMIHPKWQSTGLGSALQRRMIEFAKAKGLRGFTAEILTSNNKMVRLAKSASNKVSITSSDGVFEITTLF
jgi:acyl-CoA hydrolase/RimJ/RimL family protein N-acetyltransferase